MADERFDQYLKNMARGLSGERFTCTAVIPDVDGGLLFMVREGQDRPRRVKLEYGGTNLFERNIRFTPLRKPWSLAIEAAFHRHVKGQPHPLMGFTGQDIDEMVLRRGVPLQDVWRRYLQPGQTRWNSYLLEKIEPSTGALYLRFRGKPGPVVLRITDREDPRLDQALEYLLVNNLALSLTQDERRAKLPPTEQVERYIAFLLAHTTGPSTRIKSHSGRSPDVTLYGKDVRMNPFVPEGRQGASGMNAALAGRPRQAIKMVTLGDQSCRQTFPAFSSLPFFDTWSYFPVSTVPAAGSWVAVDYSENDVVGGAEDKLHQVLRALKKRQQDVKVVLIQTCVSRLVGDDVRGILKNELKDGDFLILDPDFQTRDAAVDSLVWPWLLKTFRPAVKPATGRAQRQRVNLAGLGERGYPSIAELEAMLARLGVDLNVCLFPSFREEELESFYLAPVTIASTCSIVRHAFSLAVRADPDHRWAFLDPPFGLKQTRAWTSAVLSEVLAGRRLKNARAILDRMRRSYAKKLQPLKEALSGNSIALMASARFSSFLFDPAEAFGVPLVPMLTELGLDVELFVYQDIPPPRDLGEFVHGRERVTLNTFDDRDELLQAVSASGSKLLLTSIRRNSQVLSLGKLPVSIHAFEMGFEGALRTADRLRHLCRTDFVDRYRRYFWP